MNLKCNNFLKYFGTIKNSRIGDITILGYARNLGCLHGSFSEMYLRRYGDTLLDSKEALPVSFNDVEVRSFMGVSCNDFDIQEVMKYSIMLELLR